MHSDDEYVSTDDYQTAIQGDGAQHLRLVRRQRIIARVAMLNRRRPETIGPPFVICAARPQSLK